MTSIAATVCRTHRSSALQRWRVPPQHGAWVALAAALAAGMVTGGIHPAQLGLAAGGAFGMTSRYAAWLALRKGTHRRTLAIESLFFGIAALCALFAAAALYQLPYFLWLPAAGVMFGLASLHPKMRRLEHSVWMHAAGMAQISMFAPLSLYAATGEFGLQVLLLEATTLAVFVGSVVRVHCALGRMSLNYLHRWTLASRWFACGALALCLAPACLLEPAFAWLSLTQLPGLLRATPRRAGGARLIGIKEAVHAAGFVGILAVVWQIMF